MDGETKHADDEIGGRHVNGYEDENNDDYEIEMKPLVSSGREDDDAGPRPGESETVGGTSTRIQVAVNIFISFVGAGLLGMPYAFSRSGWLLGTVSLCFVSGANVYCMLLLVTIRKQLESEGHRDIVGYGDIGRVVSGARGETLVNVCLVISQLGFATAYIIFIAANVYSITKTNRAYICFGCAPFLAVLVQAKEMRTLSPFSLIADMANLLGISAVLFQDYETYRFDHAVTAAIDFRGLLYVVAISIYSLEGVAMILPLESSCKDRRGFPSLLKVTVLGITVLMAVFGCCGAVAFGPDTLAPVTLNLEGAWANFVKLCLCGGLYLTYPVMLFPVNKVMEDMCLPNRSEGRSTARWFRASVVFFSTFVAWSVPDFGKFLSLVGSSICLLLGFVLPCYFHLVIFSERKMLERWQIVINMFLVIFGTVFGILGTKESFQDIFMHSDPDIDSI